MYRCILCHSKKTPAYLCTIPHAPVLNQRLAASTVDSGEVLNMRIALGAPRRVASTTCSKKYVFWGMPRIPNPITMPSRERDLNASVILSMPSSGVIGINSELYLQRHATPQQLCEPFHARQSRARQGLQKVAANTSGFVAAPRKAYPASSICWTTRPSCCLTLSRTSSGTIG